MNRNGSASCPVPGADWLWTELLTESGGSTEVDHIGPRQLSSDSAGNSRNVDAALQRRLATGRESQRRFRERQKARAQEAEAQLSKATTELSELRTRHAELEARNRLLERLTKVIQPVQPEFLQQAEASQQTAPAPDPPPEAGGQPPPGVLIMVAQPPYRMSLEEASKLTIPAFSALWTEHVRQIGGLLMQIGDPTATSVQDAILAMQDLTVEAFKLIQCMLHNPATNQVLITSRLDDASRAANLLDDRFYSQLLNLISLTDDQTQDIITIRRVYMTKRASLDEQRRAVVEEMGRYEQQCLHPADTVVALSALAEQIRDISAQDFKAYCAVISGFYQGVLTTQQLAGIMVHVYPFLPVLDKTLGAVAARGGVYGMDIPPAALEDLQQIAAEWGQFEAYVAHVTAQVWHDYMPFRLV